MNLAPNPVTATPPGVSFFNGANGMDPSAKLPVFPAGFVGRVRVDATKGITRRDGSRAFIAEFSILSSSMPEKVVVGGKYSWYQGLKEPGTAYPACISFLYAALGLDVNKHRDYIANEIKSQQDSWLNRAANEPGLLAGAELDLQTALKKTKSNTDFTLHAFKATPEAIAATDAQLK